MSSNLSAVPIKRADRMHDVRRLKSLSEPRQRRTVSERLDVSSLLAHRRLRMADLQWQLEDEAFKYVMPRQYKAVSRLIGRRRAQREAYTQRSATLLSQALEDAGLHCTVRGRTKHLYSTYQKLKRYHARGRKFHEIYDLIALRVVVDSPADCYSALEVVHEMWRPIPGEFDDYIANPKENFYQSLHTSVIGPEGHPLEVQIRTEEMHQIAEHGVAAHRSYKQTQPHHWAASSDQKPV